MTGNKIRQKTWFFCIITTVQEGNCPVLVQSACIANASSLLLCTKQLMHAACRQSLIEAYFGLIFFSRKLTCRKDWSLNGSRLLFIFSSSVFCILSWFFFFFFYGDCCGYFFLIIKCNDNREKSYPSILACFPVLWGAGPLLMDVGLKVEAINAGCCSTH